MPAATSTPTALKSEAGPWQGRGWRAVEAQHKNATLALVHGDLEAQALLEDIIDAVKPALPTEARGLHFLLATPFRYPPPPAGSRFRRPQDPGVFYGAEDPRTACAEAGYWRWRFWMDSAGLSARSATLQMTLFQFRADARAALDLTAPPFRRRRRQWTDRNDYAATQALAAQARDEGIDLIRYESARNGPDGRCLAVLSAAVFRTVGKSAQPQQQGWSLFIQPPDLTVWQRALDGESFSFRY